jgi:hypothetical protein
MLRMEGVEQVTELDKAEAIPPHRLWTVRTLNGRGETSSENGNVSAIVIVLLPPPPVPHRNTAARRHRHTSTASPRASRTVRGRGGVRRWRTTAMTERGTATMRWTT